MNNQIAYEKIRSLTQTLGTVIRGKSKIIELAVAVLLSKGHLLIEDVPGVGKTTLAHGLARSISCTFQRIQFTSDLLPSDCIGVTVYNDREHAFEFRRGPLFANVVLADEINRATPRTQSALLEAMNDRQVSVDGVTHPLPEPFMLLATQNPAEFSGTFPLPESQLDRFTMCMRIGYPDLADERLILTSIESASVIKTLSPVLTTTDVTEMQRLALDVRVDEDIVNYILAITEATRNHRGVKLGISPRGAMTLYKTLQAISLVKGRDYAIPDDVKLLATPVFAHRIIPAGAIEEESSEESSAIIEEILSTIKVPI
ncbi:AAA family ATPase [bacterium]|nr:MAG: AAA family ATPase [bacterium]